MGISAVVCTRTDASSTGPPSTESPFGIPRVCGGESEMGERERPQRRRERGREGERARDARCAMRDAPCATGRAALEDAGSLFMTRSQNWEENESVHREPEGGKGGSPRWESQGELWLSLLNPPDVKRNARIGAERGRR